MKKIRLLFILASLFVYGCAIAPHHPQVAGPGGIYHIVGSGQTLYRISQAYAVDVHEVIRLNNIQNPNQIGVGDKLFIPRAAAPLPVRPSLPLAIEPIEKIVGQKQYKVKWKTVTLHHSGTLKGNAEAFDRNHRKRGMGGLAYHFVIDNGSNGCYDGEIEVGWRWARQRESIRRRDIQICAVGNFNKEEISQAQFNSLVKLLKVIARQYSIPLSNIRRHKDVRGKITECPGDSFPLYRILAELRKG